MAEVDGKTLLEKARLVPLSQGQFAIVDAEDYERVMAFKWCCVNNRGILYAARTTGPKHAQVHIRMHRFILDLPKNGPQVDHKDWNGLNNRRSNLRICTDSDNGANARKPTGTSRFRGVYWHKKDQRFAAHIKKNGKMFHIGNFLKEEDAARARDAAALELHGEFAILNFSAEGRKP